MSGGVTQRFHPSTKLPVQEARSLKMRALSSPIYRTNRLLCVLGRTSQAARGTGGGRAASSWPESRGPQVDLWSSTETSTEIADTARDEVVRNDIPTP